ncbi:hypothetical protein B296_00005895 [Ensete ventricosum]|uniref:Uncharacterized protein n=1 Tax=Ensete ventricosum TaxID=4639 RepID=A0A427AHZ3_ENSVE|nr:hypothetical protein B296_00005895 [Ensete ventricosum]
MLPPLIYEDPLLYRYHTAVSSSLSIVPAAAFLLPLPNATIMATALPHLPLQHVAATVVVAAFFSTCTSSVAAPLTLGAATRFLPYILLCYRRHIGDPYADNLVATKSYYIYIMQGLKPSRPA